MSRNQRRKVVRNAGAFLSPVGLIPVPMRTLSDDIPAAEPEPVDDREPEHSGSVRRLIRRLTHRD